MSRQVIFYSTQTQKRSNHETEATTFGEFMDEIGQEVSKTMRYYIKENRNSLENLEAILPDEDSPYFNFTLIASPRDNKAAAARSSIDDYSNSELREFLTKATNLVNTILNERGEDLYEEREVETEEFEEPIEAVNDGWV